MKIRVVDVIGTVTEDIDLEARFDVKALDAAIATCLRAASDALRAAPPNGFCGFERDHLASVIEGMRSSHLSIRKLLYDGFESSAVDALVVARLQVETLYNYCFLHINPANLRLFLKNGWKKQYIRFLLEKAEREHLARANTFYSETGPDALERLRAMSFVTEEERRWIEFEELGNFPCPALVATIPKFPTPMGVIDLIEGGADLMLKRLYPEYQFLCNFAHGAHEAVLFRNLTDSRSPVRHFIEPWKVLDVGRRQVAEPAILYSAISCICVATEVYAARPTETELAAKLISGWTLLTSVSLVGKALWNLRAKKALGVL